MYLELFFSFFKIGLFTFGGGYAMIPLIVDEVMAHGWISMPELIDFIAVSESTPGPFAVNIATYVGMETAGFVGSACATLGVVLPSFLIILLIAKCFSRFRENLYVQGILSGLRPAVIGLIATAVITTGKTVISAAGSHTGILCSVFIFIIMLFLSIKKIHPVKIIILSATIGILLGKTGIL